MRGMKSLLAIALLAALPFPAPKVIQPSPETKCDWGPVVSTGQNEVVIKTDVGQLTVKVSSSSKIVGLDGKELSGISALKPGGEVRVYYLVEKGAQAQEIDVTK